MLPASQAQAKLRELTDRRKPLAERFEHHPEAIHLALEIKAIDDQIAECNRQIQAERKRQK
jgi:hypothetical protein